MGERQSIWQARNQRVLTRALNGSVLPRVPESLGAPHLGGGVHLMRRMAVWRS